jgi:hypothetical protein
MGDGDHFGAEGDWSEDKERRLRDGITGIAKVVLDARDAALARATAAEAREAGLREALARIRAFARPIWSDARCGDEMRKIDADCLDDICDMVDVALAAPAKEVKP